MSDLIVKFYFTIRERYTYINITVSNGNDRVISESRCTTCVFVVDVRYNGIELYILIFLYIYHCYFVLIHCWEVGVEGGWPPPSNMQAMRKALAEGLPPVVTAPLRLASI